jgi:hypothetical protein
MVLGGLTPEQNMNIIDPVLYEEEWEMAHFIRDVAALSALVSFVAVLGFWTEVVRSLV